MSGASAFDTIASSLGLLAISGTKQIWVPKSQTSGPNEYTVDAAGAGYAKVTYERLPRELRDMVYHHLWSTVDQRKDKSLDKAIYHISRTGFAAPCIVGEHFAREAFECLYEHDILEYKVSPSRLRRYLFNRRLGVDLAPVDCCLRSVNVVINCPTPSPIEYENRLGRRWMKMLPDPVSVEDEITDKFTPLLQLNLIAGFRLTIHILARFTGDGFDVHNLLAISQRVKAVSKVFAEKKSKVRIEFEFQFDGCDSIGDSWPWHWKTTSRSTTMYKQGLHISSPYLMFYGGAKHFRFQGDDTGNLLEADADTWEIFLNEHWEA